MKSRKKWRKFGYMHKAKFSKYDSWEEMETARAFEASQTSYTERFYILMRLIKISSMIRNARIIKSPEIPSHK